MPGDRPDPPEETLGPGGMAETPRHRHQCGEARIRPAGAGRRRPVATRFGAAPGLYGRRIPHVGIGREGRASAGRLRHGIGAARTPSAKDHREYDQGDDPGKIPGKGFFQHSSTIDYNQRRNLCAIHCLTLSTTGLFFHFSSRISSDSARSLANIASISAANSLLRITAFTSSLMERLKKSMLVEPTVDQTLSITAVFACSRTPRRR